CSDMTSLLWVWARICGAPGRDEYTPATFLAESGGIFHPKSFCRSSAFAAARSPAARIRPVLGAVIKPRNKEMQPGGNVAWYMLSALFYLSHGCGWRTTEYDPAHQLGDLRRPRHGSLH